MKKTERLKYATYGILLIIAGIAAFIWNWMFSEIISLGIIPLTAGLMVLVGIIFIRRAISGY